MSNTYLFLITNNDETVFIDRNDSTGAIEVNDRSVFISILKKALLCDVTDAIDLVDKFTESLSNTKALKERIVEQISEELIDITNEDELYSILRNIKNRKLYITND